MRYVMIIFCILLQCTSVAPKLGAVEHIADYSERCKVLASDVKPFVQLPEPSKVDMVIENPETVRKRVNKLGPYNIQI